MMTQKQAIEQAKRVVKKHDDTISIQTPKGWMLFWRNLDNQLCWVYDKPPGNRQVNLRVGSQNDHRL